MDVINKLYSSVSSTVSQLSSVLPGNPVTREFDANEHIASAGPGLLWKVYKGYKRSTKQEAAIFVFEKRQLERWPKDDRDVMLETLKRGVTQLTKIRHPQVLTVQHPLEESRESLAFATEPVFASLANILGNTTNMPQPAPQEIKNYKLFDVEIKYGILQLSESLSFLHSDVKLLHRNVCPESVVINQQGAWKIFGFDFCVLNQNPHDAQPSWPMQEYNSSWHVLTQPPLEYMAPEYGLISSHSAASDIYSLGMLIFALHSHGGKSARQFGKDYGSYKRFAGELKNGKYPNLSSIPDGLSDYVKLMLNATPEMRPEIHDLVKVPYFDDIGVKALSYLDSLFQWDNLQKSKFYKGLPQIIQKMPHRINMYRVLPCLIKEFVNAPMVPFVLPNVLLIAEKCTAKEYTSQILGPLKTIMKIQEPIQILLIFMQKMELLLKLTPAEDVKTDVLPMVYRALESDAQQIQELCLSVLPTFAALIDYPAMKNALLPRIKKLCINTGYVSVRVNCLLCIGKLLEHLDKWLVLDEVLPFLPLIPSREPAVLMAILGIYKLAMTHNKLGITKEVMANKVIPFLVPLCIENGITLNQFNAMMTLVKDMINRVEVEHRTKLEQLNSIQQESKALDLNFQSASGPLVPSMPNTGNSESDQMFSSLGFDGFINDTNKNLTATSTITSGMDNNVTTALSLEDKKRLVKQQEQAQRMNANSAIIPNALPQKNQKPPKDFTSTLIERNMSQINLTKKITSNPANNNANISSNWQHAEPGKSPNLMYGVNTPIQNQWSTVNQSTSTQSQWSGWQSPPVSNAPVENWSAFDNLLPQMNNSAVNSTKPSMNQMGGSSTLRDPLLMPTNGNSNLNQTKKSSATLSTQDIMDFLN